MLNERRISGCASPIWPISLLSNRIDPVLPSINSGFLESFRENSKLRDLNRKLRVCLISVKFPGERAIKRCVFSFTPDFDYLFQNKLQFRIRFEGIRYLCFQQTFLMLELKEKALNI